MEENTKPVTNEKIENKTENQTKEKGTFKTIIIKRLVNMKNLLKNTDVIGADGQKKRNIKNQDAISLMDILAQIDIENISRDLIKDICDDINQNGIIVGMDVDAIKFINENRSNENLKMLLKGLNKEIDIDIKSVAELRNGTYKNIKNICNIGKVFVNSGWDEAAKKGYSVQTYELISENVEKMLEYSRKKAGPNASQKEKFMAIYNSVLKAESYDDAALDPKNKSRRFASRSLEGFFVDKKSVCAGTALALKNLCECEGIKVQYIQGKAKGEHAWVKVKIGKDWYNCDPTWDANRVGKPYEFCLKSDREFSKTHRAKVYNPTYIRGENKKRFMLEKDNEKKSFKSINYDEIKELCDIEMIENKRIKEFEYKPSKQDLEYLDRQLIPAERAKSLSRQNRLRWLEKLAKFFSKTKYVKNIPFIKKFIEKNLVNSEKNRAKVKNEIERIKVKPSKSNAKTKTKERALDDLER